MAKTLDEFIKEAKIDVAEFERKYKEKAEKEPECYPLEFGDDNDGLWFEFLLEYMQTGEL
jgi:hypothetical protein